MSTVATDRTSGLQRELEAHHRELTAHCYRMLGSAHEAEDAVQETMVRAWRHHDRFEGRSSLRSWLYRIATNVCLDLLRGRQRRALPMDLGPGTSAAVDHPGAVRGEATWIGPLPDERVVPTDADPADVAIARDTIRLGFIAALQRLPARQRAVLLLREVLRWRATEVAELLDTSVASVNSALQRARMTLADAHLSEGDAVEPMDHAQQALLARYLDAFERYDLDELAALMRDDAVQSMPPYELWLQGAHTIRGFWAGPGAACRGSRLLPTVANGRPAFGQYRPSGPGGRHEPWALQVLEVSAGRILGFTFFLDTDRVFPLFGLPARLDPQSGAGTREAGEVQQPS
ncbi:MAG: sigma-70 family RNA polymerase sigma factor [Actinobacteria bacterium]|nr:sigma-70 family RNA polymerase sigma factor [Actinomycetota bacterium]